MLFKESETEFFLFSILVGGGMLSIVLIGVFIGVHILCVYF